MTKEKATKDPNEKYYDKPKYRFFLDQLLSTGLSLDENTFRYSKEGKGGSCPYMTPDDDGNVRFYVPDILTGDLETYSYGPTHNHKIRDWYLTRWRDPKEDKTGRPAKYTPVKGSGTRTLMTAPVVEAYKVKKQIKTLFVIEGFKKALSAAIVGGLPMIGMNGLNGFKEPGDQVKLRREIKEVLQVCKVQNVVVLYDSDLFNLSLKKEKAHTIRPNAFYRATLMAKTLFEPFADVYLAHPNRDPEKKYGLDDLLLANRNISPINSGVEIKDCEGWNGYTKQPKNKEIEILKDLVGAINKNTDGTHFKTYKLSAISDYKIKELYHLGNVQQFYDYYRKELLQIPNKTFKFYTYTYSILGDGTISQVEDEKTSNLGIEVVLGKLVRYTEKSMKELANFQMKVLFQLDSEEDPKRICEIKNYEGVTRIIEVNSKTFVSKTEFTALLISKGDFIWKGNQEDLLDLMTILFRHEKPAVQINQLGWQALDDFYAFSNGIVTASGFTAVDEYGMVMHNDKNYYLPAWSKFNARNYESFKDLKKFAHHDTKKPVSFLKWKTQMTTVYGQNGEIASCFYIASLFSDIVFSHKSGIGFPLLWSAGKPQTGKSTVCETLLNMFGQKSDAIGLAGKSTAKYFITRFAQIVNGLVHLDEYSNTKVDKSTKETLKNIFDRIGYGKKSFTNDFRTQVVPIKSAALVSGEEIPTDNHALFTRAILLMHNKDKFSALEKSNMRKLKDMEEDGLSHITVDLLRHRQLIEAHFDETYNKVFAEFHNKFKTKKIEDRMLKNAAWIITPVKILLDQEKITYNISYNELLAAFFDNIEKQNTYMAANTDVSKFWDIIDLLFAQKEISEKNGDFKFVDDCLAIQLKRFHYHYSLTARKLGYEKILDKATLENYLSNEPYHVELKNANGRKKQVRFNGNPVPAMFFKYEDIGIDLRSASTTEEPKPEVEEEVKKEDDAPILENELNEEQQKELVF